MATHSLKKQQLIQGIGLSLEEQSPGQIQSPESEDRGCCCCCQVASVVSDSVRPHRWQPTRLSHSWDSPGKNTGVVALSFSNAWKWKVKVKSLSRVWLLATPWTAAYQAPLSMGFARQEYWSGFPLSCIGEGNGNSLQCSYLENPGTGEPDGLLSMGSHRVGHDWSDLAAAGAAIALDNGCCCCCC